MATSYLLHFLIGVLLLVLCSRTTKAGYLQNDDPRCEYSEFACGTGECISRKSWCDGPSDCPDNSDESYCRTSNPSEEKSENINNCEKSRYFICDDGLCIPKSGRCDDLPDCLNGEDEENCDYLYDDTSSELETETSTSSTTPIPTTTTTTTTPTPKFLVTRGDTPWIPSRFDVLHKSVRHIIEERDTDWGWGKATPKIVTALYLANESYFDPDNYDGLMTKKELEVQLALDLLRNHEKPLKMHELVHYIHAMIVTCSNPRNFHGVNIIKLLKKSISKRQSKGLFVNPVAYLALCNSGDMPDSYIKRLKNMAFRRSEEPRWLDVQTYALLAISCQTSKNASKEWLLLKKDVVRDISEWQQADGSFGSIHSTGLALQALIAADELGSEMTKVRAMTYLLMQQDWQGSYGNDLDNYYVLPALNMKSLALLHKRSCKHHTFTPQGIAAVHPSRKDEKQMLVHYSLWIGGDKNEIQTVTLSLPRRSNFLEVMAEAERVNSLFKHNALTTGKGTAVNSIAGRASDIEKSIYWTLYRKVPLPFRPHLSNVTATVARLKLFGAKRWTKDLKKLHPRDGEHLAYWYKPYL
nr:uncharacterized protein CG3556 isoform X2 [Parasteatoda tepidariorum]